MLSKVPAKAAAHVDARPPGGRRVTEVMLQSREGRLREAGDGDGGDIGDGGDDGDVSQKSPITAMRQDDLRAH